MQAVQLLDTFAEAGFELSLTPENGLRIRPASALTEDLRGLLKTHKPELVAYLQRDAANDPGTNGRCMSEENPAPMGDDPTVAETTPQAERLAKLHTDYLVHHWGCKTCCAAGQGRGLRCPTGAALWSDYDDVAERQQHPQQKRKHA